MKRNYKKQFIAQCKSLAIAIGLSVAMMSCGEQKQNSKELRQAFEIHKEALEIREKTSTVIDNLKAIEDSVLMATVGKDLDSIGKLLFVWDEQLVEVPGFEENHEHGPNCSHDHHAQSELTPEQHLEVQKHLLQEIKTIAEGVESISSFK